MALLITRSVSAGRGLLQEIIDFLLPLMFLKVCLLTFQDVHQIWFLQTCQSLPDIWYLQQVLILCHKHLLIKTPIGAFNIFQQPNSSDAATWSISSAIQTFSLVCKHILGWKGGQVLQGIHGATSEAAQGHFLPEGSCEDQTGRSIQKRSVMVVRIPENFRWSYNDH